MEERTSDFQAVIHQKHQVSYNPPPSLSENKMLISAPSFDSGLPYRLESSERDTVNGILPFHNSYLRLFSGFLLPSLLSRDSRFDEGNVPD